MTGIKAWLNALKTDKYVRISNLTLLLAIIIFLIAVYFLTAGVVTKITLFISIVFLILATTLLIYAFNYGMKSTFIMSELAREVEQNPKKKVIRFVTFALILYIILRLLGYNSPELIGELLLVIVVYAIFVFRFYGKSTKEKKKQK